MPIRISRLREILSHADLSDMDATVHDARYYTEAEVTALLALYLKLDSSNDPLTNGLQITPNYAPSPASTTSWALRADADIILKSGQKLIFDGA